jgi:hypothetical protein
MEKILTESDICSDQENFEKVRDSLRKETSIDDFSSLFNRILNIVG